MAFEYLIRYLYSSKFRLFRLTTNAQTHTMFDPLTARDWQPNGSSYHCVAHRQLCAQRCGRGAAGGEWQATYRGMTGEVENACSQAGSLWQRSALHDLCPYSRCRTVEHSIDETQQAQAQAMRRGAPTSQSSNNDRSAWARWFYGKIWKMVLLTLNAVFISNFVHLENGKRTSQRKCDNVQKCQGIKRYEYINSLLLICFIGFSGVVWCCCCCCCCFCHSNCSACLRIYVTHFA